MRWERPRQRRRGWRCRTRSGTRPGWWRRAPPTAATACCTSATARCAGPHMLSRPTAATPHPPATPCGQPRDIDGPPADSAAAAACRPFTTSEKRDGGGGGARLQLRLGGYHDAPIAQPPRAPFDHGCGNLSVSGGAHSVYSGARGTEAAGRAVPRRSGWTWRRKKMGAASPGPPPPPPPPPRSLLPPPTRRRAPGLRRRGRLQRRPHLPQKRRCSPRQVRPPASLPAPLCPSAPQHAVFRVQSSIGGETDGGPRPIGGRQP